MVELKFWRLVPEFYLENILKRTTINSNFVLYVMQCHPKVKTQEHCILLHNFRKFVVLHFLSLSSTIKMSPVDHIHQTMFFYLCVIIVANINVVTGNEANKVPQI